MTYPNHVYPPGTRLGRLVILRQVPIPEGSKVKGRWYECRCDCHTICVRSQGSLRGGYAKSCGCYRRETSRATAIRTAQRKGSQESTFRAGERTLYRRYKKGATKRDHAFDLTYEQCVCLFQMPCHYCGAAPAMVARPIGKYCTQAPFLANGLDRVDNALGYTVKNTVPCCRTCNHLKSDRSLVDWLAHMRQILIHQHFKALP